MAKCWWFVVFVKSTVDCWTKVSSRTPIAYQKAVPENLPKNYWNLLQSTAWNYCEVMPAPRSSISEQVAFVVFVIATYVAAASVAATKSVPTVEHS